MFFVWWFIGLCSLLDDSLVCTCIVSISFILPSFKICKMMPRVLYLNRHILLFLVKIPKFQISLLLDSVWLEWKYEGWKKKRGKQGRKWYFPLFGLGEKTQRMENIGEKNPPGPTNFYPSNLGGKVGLSTWITYLPHWCVICKFFLFFILFYFFILLWELACLWLVSKVLDSLSFLPLFSFFFFNSFLLCS